MRRALAIAFMLFVTACAQSKPEVASIAAPPPAPPPPLAGAATPHHLDIAGALYQQLATCDPDAQADCAAAPNDIRIDGARCTPIAPEDGQPSAACRVDWTERFRDARAPVQRRDQCVRFILLNVEGEPDGRIWAVRYTSPGHVCEVPAQ